MNILFIKLQPTNQVFPPTVAAVYFERRGVPFGILVRGHAGLRQAKVRNSLKSLFETAWVLKWIGGQSLRAIGWPWTNVRLGFKPFFGAIWGTIKLTPTIKKHAKAFWFVTHKASSHQGALQMVSSSLGGRAEVSDDVNIYKQSNSKTNSCMSSTSPESLSVFTEGWSLKVVAAHCIIICCEQQHAGTTDGCFPQASELSRSRRRSNISYQLMLVWLSRGERTHLWDDMCHHVTFPHCSFFSWVGW